MGPVAGYRFKQCEQFSDTGDHIVVFRSSDNVLFNIDRRQLQATTNGPLAVDLPAGVRDVTPLEEDADTLETLFQFVYPRGYPSLEEAVFERLYKVAEAAEKYDVCPAVAITKIWMSASQKEHLLEVMSYAYRHGYAALLDKVAPRTVDVSVEKALDQFACLPLFIAWTRYKDAFHQLFLRTTAFDYVDSHHTICYKFTVAKEMVHMKMHDHTPTSVSDGEALFDGKVLEEVVSECPSETLHYAPNCRKSTRRWKESLKQRIRDVPPLSRFEPRPI